jgi:hypothetical protein
MTQILIALQLARVIAGEAPGCSIDAKLAVAWVADNRVQQRVVEKWREGWYGDRAPQATDLAVALLWPSLPDPTGGATFLVGPGDAPRMPWLAGMTRARRWQCPGTYLEAYREEDHGGQH